MFARSRDILTECREVWPLASRWVESLDKIAQNPKSMVPTAEGAMAGGKDPIPRLLNQPPPLPQEHEGESVTSLFPTVASTEPAAHFPHYPETLSQTVQQPSAPFQTMGAFPLQPSQHLPLQAQAQQLHPQEQQQQHQPVQLQQPAQPTMYLPHPPPEPINDMSLMMDVFSQPGAGSYHVAGHPVTESGTPLPTYYPTIIGPRNDGFENELQSCIAEGSEWMQSHAGDWMGSYEGDVDLM